VFEARGRSGSSDWLRGSDDRALQKRAHVDPCAFFRNTTGKHRQVLPSTMMMFLGIDNASIASLAQCQYQVKTLT
jgi:hypothetical protein